MEGAIPFKKEDLKEILCKYFGTQKDDVDVESCDVHEIAEIIKDMII